DHVPALFNLGQTLKKAGQAALALEAFEKAAQQGPDDPMLRVPLVEILLEGEEWEKALQAAGQLVNNFPRFAQGYYLEGFALWRLGRLEESLSRTRQASALDSDRADHHRLAAQILQALGRPDEAQKELEAARKLEQ
ncbi:MAG: tetratricopeptide repeat protein, partial [Acidobacteriota bacterium]